MKNLKQMIDDFQSEAKKRIANGEFEVIEARASTAYAYFANVKIMIDSVTFNFELPEGKGFICDLSDFKIYPYHIGDEDLEALKNAYKVHCKDSVEAEIAILESKIAKLRNNGN